MSNQVTPKKVVVPIEKELEAPNKLYSGYTMKVLAAMYGVGEVTVGDWRRIRSKLEQWLSNQASTPTGRKTMKLSDYKMLNMHYSYSSPSKGRKVFRFQDQYCKKRLSFTKKIPNTATFNASSGWLYRWKKGTE